MTRTCTISRRRLLAGAGAAASAGILGVFGTAFLHHRPQRNVIFIIHDAMRGDSLGAIRSINGVPQSLTPFLDSLAAQSLSFDRAIAPSSFTMTSMGSLLYDASPLDVDFDGTLHIRNGTHLATRLEQAGHTTVAVVANTLLKDPTVQSAFQQFIAHPLRKGLVLNQTIRAVVSRFAQTESFFLYLHYMDTHDPYTATKRTIAELGERYEPQVNLRDVRRQYFTGETALALPVDEAIRCLRAQYDASVRYADRTTANLFAALDACGLLDETLVIITADHGEEFLDAEITEEKNVGHGRHLLWPAIHVPLLLWERGIQPATIQEPFASLRIINDAIGLWMADGHISLKWLRGETQKPILSFLDKTLCLAWGPGALWFVEPFKGFSFIEGTLRLHGRLDQSGGIERIALFPMSRGGSGTTQYTSPALMPALYQGAVRRARGILSRRDAPEPAQTIDPETRRQLEALGYLN